jgi:hypothetical protein
MNRIGDHSEYFLLGLSQTLLTRVGVSGAAGPGRCLEGK